MSRDMRARGCFGLGEAICVNSQGTGEKRHPPTHTQARGNAGAKQTNTARSRAKSDGRAAVNRLSQDRRE
jgi:hypothetical protein